MKAAFVLSALMGAALAAPSGCSSSYSGQFEITVAQVTTAKRDVGELQERGTCGSDGSLVLTLADGVLLDAQGRTGYIASNYQFQFDNPPQAGAIVSSGWSVCSDSELALGNNKTFYRCLSGDFYNLYNVNWAAQCEAVSILAEPCGSGSASQGSDGQVIGTTVVATTIVTALSDGQPQVVTTSVSVTLYTTYPTSAVVSQISDGQIQAPPPTTTTAAPGTTYAATTAPASSAPASSSAAGSSAASSSAASSSAAASSSVAKTTSAASSSAAASSATTAATSAPSSSSSRVMAGSLSALIFGLLVAFICL